MGFQRLDRDFLVLLLRLKQDNGPDSVGIVLGGLGQRDTSGNRAADRVLPGVVLGQEDRQLNQIFAFEFLGR